MISEEWMLAHIAGRLDDLTKSEAKKKRIKEALRDAYYHGRNMALADARIALGIKDVAEA